MRGGNCTSKETLPSVGSVAPYSASSVEFNRDPVLFIFKDGVANVDSGEYAASALFLFQIGSEASDTSVAL